MGSQASQPAPLALRCSILKHVPHGFSTRNGGISTGVYESLNFGSPGDVPLDDRDTAENVARNYRRLLAVVGATGRRLLEVYQVHGNAVDVVSRASPRPAGAPDPKADAIVTDDPATVVAVRTADCLPLLLASGDGRVVAAVHAGWRGVLAGIVQASVDAMRGLGADGVVGAIGPCICGEAFEVGEEVAEQFERVFRPETLVVLRRPQWPRPHIDLKRAVFLQLAASGAAGAQVLPNCTYSEPELFFSHRRSRKTGRMAAVIAPASPR
ncbi:MAG TPA: peptidoglycan editing factor PgeF [Phycisphaerales bacterium]|nr:peptidoglycan editing factor PgeF [Phycisphaerales bacterium]